MICVLVGGMCRRDMWWGGSVEARLRSVVCVHVKMVVIMVVVTMIVMVVMMVMC